MRDERVDKRQIAGASERKNAGNEKERGTREEHQEERGNEGRWYSWIMHCGIYSMRLRFVGPEENRWK